MNAWWETEPKHLLVKDDWAMYAACKDHPNPAIFFPGDRPQFRDSLEARQICASCSVWQECLDTAMKRHEPYGIWGGLLHYERRRLGAKRDKVNICVSCKLIRVIANERARRCENCSTNIQQKRLS